MDLQIVPSRHYAKCFAEYKNTNTVNNNIDEEGDTAPEQWRSQCIVARIQRDAAIAVLSAIEERYIDGCDTYEDWKFMGSTAREFLSPNNHPDINIDK